MNQKYSPYRYVDLSSDKWEDISEQLVKEAENQGHLNPAETVSAEFSKQIVKALFAFPDKMKNARIADSPKKVCIVGGGISGLVAAYELYIRGHNVTLLEASARLGGRIMTRRFPDGTYGELGAMRIPGSHGCVSHYVDKFNIKRRTFVNQNANGYLYLRGERSRIGGLKMPGEYENLRGKYDLAEDRFHQVNILSPFDSLDRLFEQVGASLGLEELDLIFKHFEIPPRVQYLEQTSVGQVLRGQPTCRNSVFLSQEAWEFIGRATGVLWFEQVSCLQWLINELPLYEPDKYELEGGMETLCDAFVRYIEQGESRTSPKCNLIRNAPVRELRLQGKRVEVLWESAGRTENNFFDYVICTTPAPVTARFSFDPQLTPKQFEALTNLSYASAGKSLIHCSQRFWELKDGIVGGASYSDLPHQQCWYPSDNSEVAVDARVKFGLIRDSAQAIDWKAYSAQKSKQPGVFTAAYLWGTNASRFAALELEDSERTALILSSVEKIHPRIRSYIKNVDTDVVNYSWDSHSNPGHGAFAFFAPGEQSRYQKQLCEPHFMDADRIPRLFFAGEHLAIAHAWIQSAVQTALSAVLHVMESP